MGGQAEEIWKGNRMTIKEWLNRGRLLDLQINKLLAERDRTFDLAIKVTGSIQEDKVQTSKKNTSEMRFVKYTSYTDKIDKRVDELVEIKQEILSAINEVEDPTLRTLLQLRYINFETWEQIAIDMHYSYMQVCRLHGKALEKVKML